VSENIKLMSCYEAVFENVVRWTNEWQQRGQVSYTCAVWEGKKSFQMHPYIFTLGLTKF